MGEMMYEEKLKEYEGRILPPHHPHSKMVEKVMEKLVPASGLDGVKWETKVIEDDEQMNAVVLTG